MDVSVEFVYLGYDGLYDALATGQVDMLLAALVVLPEKTADFAYSRSYFDAGQILMIKAGTTDIGSMRDLKGKSVAVELGSAGHVEASRWQRRLGDLTIWPGNTAREALDSVVDGNSDAALVDSVSGQIYTADYGRLVPVAPAVTTEPYAAVVRIEDSTLLAQIDEIIRDLERSGRLAAIVSSWLDP